jgi:hypothetical protein
MKRLIIKSAKPQVDFTCVLMRNAFFNREKIVALQNNLQQDLSNGGSVREDH